MKVLFLDVDGVLNSTRSMIACSREYKAYYSGLSGRISSSTDLNMLRHYIDSVAVGLINRITEDYDVKLCISSTHRKHIPIGVDGTRNLDVMQKYFAAFGLTGEVIGYTKCSKEAHRGTEIAEWLDSRYPTIDRYAIVDDDSDMTLAQMSFFVRTNHYDGLSYQDYKSLVDIFKE